MLSIQAAASQFAGTSAGRHVKLTHACEIDKNCQKVLSKTYPGHCIFNDVESLSSGNGSAHCVVHNKFCKYSFGEHRSGNRVFALILRY